MKEHGFVKTPNELTFDRKLTMGARVTYTALRHLAWKAGRQEPDDGVKLPARDVVAELIGCSLRSLDEHIRELKAQGWMAQTGRAQNVRYFVFDVPQDAESTRRICGQAPAKSAGASHTHNAFQEKSNTRTSLKERTSRAPILRRLDGREPVFDAVAEVCEVDVDAQGSEIARAVKTINRLAWEDVPEGLSFAEGEWQNALASEVRRRAQLYHRAFGIEIDLTPRALARWWRDIERRAMRQVARSLTPAEIASMPEEML